MSNTSTVTPYETGAAVVACIALTAGLISWLAEGTPEERQADDRLKKQRRREIVTTLAKVDRSGLGDTRPTAEIKAVGLRLRNANSLVRSAEKLGYRTEKLPKASNSMARPPQILLRHDSGERLAITKSNAGHLVVHTAGNTLSVESLVREHTVDRAVEHLKAKGMSVRTGILPNGEMQILANEPTSPRQNSGAEVKAQIAVDGTVLVDVDKVRGNRCDNIVNDLADAIGGAVSGTSKKDSYFLLPGEPAKTSVKV